MYTSVQREFLINWNRYCCRFTFRNLLHTCMLLSQFIFNILFRKKLYILKTDKKKFWVSKCTDKIVRLTVVFIYCSETVKLIYRSLSYSLDHKPYKCVYSNFSDKNCCFWWSWEGQEEYRASRKLCILSAWNAST